MAIDGEQHLRTQLVDRSKRGSKRTQAKNHRYQRHFEPKNMRFPVHWVYTSEMSLIEKPFLTNSNKTYFKKKTPHVVMKDNNLYTINIKKN